jgi:hypothetical protein
MERRLFAGLFVLMLCFSGIHAQIGYTPRQGATILNTRNMEPHHVDVIDGVATMRYANDLPYFVGSPYLDEEFRPGTMKSIDGTLIPNLYYRYDIYADRMEFLLNGDTATINRPLAIEYVEIEGRKFEYEVYLLVKDKVATGYFEVLYEGEFMSALSRRRIELEQDIYVANYGGGGGTKDFKMKQIQTHFIRPSNSAAIIITNKKDLYSVMPGHEHKLKTFMKENRISLKREDDFYQVVQYMDRLVRGTG